MVLGVMDYYKIGMGSQNFIVHFVGEENEFFDSSHSLQHLLEL